MSEFKREERYLVVKLKRFNPWQRDNLKEKFSRDLVECVVVESDWPIYEETWENLQRLVEGQPSIKTELAALKEEINSLRQEVKPSAGLIEDIATYVESLENPNDARAIRAMAAENLTLKEENERLKANVEELVEVLELWLARPTAAKETRHDNQ